MRLDLTGSRIVKCNYSNEMVPDTELNLQVSMNNQIKLPNNLTADSIGTIITKVMVGSPMHPLCLFVEQICEFKDVEPGKGGVPDMEEMMSLYKMICMPMATQKMQEKLNGLCSVYGIPQIQIQNLK